jgi:hypothetical protein
MRHLAQRAPKIRRKRGKQTRGRVNKTTTALSCLLITLFSALVYLRSHEANQLVIIRLEGATELKELLAKHHADPQRTLHQQKNATTISTSSASTSAALPAWIQQYLHWHQEQRLKYPGKALFNDPNAPNLLVRTCLGICGGLVDRLGQLPWDLYLANQTNRVLLLHWHRPVPLENFLLPNELDWTVSVRVPGFFGRNRLKSIVSKEMRIARNVSQLFRNYDSVQPTLKFWETDLDAAIKRANRGEFKNEKILRHRLLGHLFESQLEKRLAALGETDMIHSTTSFGKIFWMFFRLNPAVQAEVDTVFKSLQLRPSAQTGYYKERATSTNDASLYSAVHCRVRHPKATGPGIFVLGSKRNHSADKMGLPWTGDTRTFAIQTATHALQCALHEPDEPVYFFSDSNDLVRYMSHELTLDAAAVAFNKTRGAETSVEQNAFDVVSSMRVVARNVTLENVHIDKQKGREPSAYYGVFVDFMLAFHARCVTFGVGNFAFFATKLAGNTCTLLYQKESYGRNKAKESTAKCKL